MGKATPRLRQDNAVGSILPRLFGFLRAGEFTCPSREAFTQDMLSSKNVSVDSHVAPSHLAVRLKQSKTDTFGVGTTLHLGTTILCPVTAMLGYLAIRQRSSGPLFLFWDGSTLSRPRLIKALREALKLIGVDDSKFSGHSFRIGATPSYKLWAVGSPQHSLHI